MTVLIVRKNLIWWWVQVLMRGFNVLICAWNHLLSAAKCIKFTSTRVIQECDSQFVFNTLLLKWKGVTTFLDLVCSGTLLKSSNFNFVLKILPNWCYLLILSKNWNVHSDHLQHLKLVSSRSKSGIIRTETNMKHSLINLQVWMRRMTNNGTVLLAFHVLPMPSSNSVIFGRPQTEIKGWPKKKKKKNFYKTASINPYSSKRWHHSVN